MQHLKRLRRVSARTKLLLALGLLVIGSIIVRTTGRINADGPVNVWWPTQNAKIGDTQPFKAMMEGRDVGTYSMTWSVDGGQENPMYDSWTDYPHKEAMVNISSWTWKGSGPYAITFRAKDNAGASLGEASVTIYTPSAPENPVTVMSAVSQAVGVPVAVASLAPAPALSVGSLDVWWPTSGTVMQGVQPLKAMVPGMDASNYDMYWQVGGGEKKPMDTSFADYPHKEAWVDFGTWTSGSYDIAFVATKDGATIATKSVSVTVNGAAQTSVASVAAASPKRQKDAAAASPSPSPSYSPVPVSSSGSLAGVSFYVNPNSNAKRQADQWRASRPADAAQMDKIASSPEAIWLGGWSGDVKSAVAAKVADARSQGAVPVFIAYNIPNRDCGQYSAGGVSGADVYRSWIGGIAAGLGGSKAVVVLEPDALALTDCLSGQQKDERFAMIRDAVSTLRNAGAMVYIDAAHPDWVAPADMASRLKAAGVDAANGFAVNVSNFYTTESNVSYGSAISSALGGKHFVVDTARNGLGPNGSEWCNPMGRALGIRSTTNTGNALVDAFLWLKNPGESDGNCNGGPSAGTWWPEYALGLAQRASY